MNCWCSFSLAKLMHSCSNEFTGITSNPKMSSTPMVYAWPSCAIMFSVIFSTSHRKSFTYIPLASASRVAIASTGFIWIL